MKKQNKLTDKLKLVYYLIHRFQDGHVRLKTPILDSKLEKAAEGRALVNMSAN